MSGNAASSRGSRRWAIRIACFAVYCVVIVFLFVNGKGHTILIDNKDAADGAHPALEYALVGVDGAEGAEYYPGDRDKASVKGQVHRVVVELDDGTKVEKTIRVPLSEDMVLVSVPLLIADADGAVVPFVPLDAAPPPSDDIGNTNEFTAPTGPEEPPTPSQQ